MFNFHIDHKNLVGTAFFVFLSLSILVAVMPAFLMQNTEPLPEMKPYTEQEKRGMMVYNSENCVSCHTQQVRNIEMDMVWGNRPSIPSDYYYSKQRLDVWRQSPSLLGSERTGPDLTNIGLRQPGNEWHLLHMYNPRIVMESSIMPGYPWLYEEKYPDEVKADDIVVPIPDEFRNGSVKKIVATQKLMDLIAYLHTLKQTELGTTKGIDFIPALPKTAMVAGGGGSGGANGATGSTLDGALLYSTHCGACHQADGKGLAGAFPSLVGSQIVLDANPEVMIKIVLQGYDARPEYSVMAPFADVLTDEEIAAIVTHERTNWGNNASAVTADEVKKIREFISKP